MLTGQPGTQSNISWQWCWIRRTMTEYSVCVETGQPDTQSNIVWQWCRIRRTLSWYSVVVATGQPDTQCNIVWQWCQIRWILPEYLVGVATGQPDTQSNIVWAWCQNQKTPTGYMKGSGVRLHGYYWMNHISQHSPTYSDWIHWTQMESSRFQWVPLDCCSHCGGSSSSSRCTVVVFVVDGVGLGRGQQNSMGSRVWLGWYWWKAYCNWLSPAYSGRTHQTPLDKVEPGVSCWILQSDSLDTNGVQWAQRVRSE